METKTEHDIKRWHTRVRNYWPEATEEYTAHILDAHTSWPDLADVVVMEQIVEHLKDMGVIEQQRSLWFDETANRVHHGEMKRIEPVTPVEVAELKTAVEQLNYVMQIFDERPQTFGVGDDTDKGVTASWTEADKAYREVADKLRAKGIDDDDDLLHAIALDKNPLYQPPAPMGYLGEGDLDEWVQHDRDDGMEMD